MTYQKFLTACLTLCSEKRGEAELPVTEFTALINEAAVRVGEKDKPPKTYSVKYIRNIMKGYYKPGRDLLEAAALAAGVDFKDCIQAPTPSASPNDWALQVFREALDPNDSRMQMALSFAAALRGISPYPKRRAKTGGRTRSSSR